MFEICYHYYQKNEDGPGYDISSAKSFTKKYKDADLDQVATTVMKQLARRDLMVFDVEIYEYAKRKITFKETKGGVIIKNKKFSLDGNVESIEEIPEQLPQDLRALTVPNPQLPNNHRPMRHEIYDPEPGAKKFNMTPKKRYPVLQEKTVMQKVNINGMLTEMPGCDYLTVDDTGNQVRVPSMHFMPEQRGLIGMENVQREESPNLMFMGEHTTSMPVLRR